MDNLEKYIRENQSKFDLNEPPAALWEKIDAQRETKPQVSKLRVISMRAMKLAASLAILALASYGFFKLIEQPETVVEVTEQNNVPSQLVEMDQYYEAQVAGYYNTLTQVIDDEEILADVKNDLSLLNEEKQRLMKEYQTEISDEEVLQALINTYRMKIQILEDILSLLNEDNNEENSI